MCCLCLPQVTPADVEFLRKHTSGYICVGMEGDVLDRLQLPLMVSSAENDEAMYTAFTVSVHLNAFDGCKLWVHMQHQYIV